MNICGKSELCIFDRATPQAVVDSAVFDEIFPVNNISGNNGVDIEFNINGSSSEYLDLNDTLLYIKLKVIKADGKDLVEADDVRASQYMFHTLFSDAILSFNNVIVEGGNNMYGPKALIETLINYSGDTKEITLDPIGYDTDANLKIAIAKSKTYEMCGSLQLDFFDQPKYLIPGVNVHLRLKRDIPKYSLVTPTAAFEPQIEILEAKLIVRKVKVEQSVFIGHQLGLEKRNACYPIRKTNLVQYSLGKGTTTFYKDQIFGDMTLPKFILITFQSTATNSGNYKTEPAHYEHNNVSSIQVSRNSDYRETYTQNFEKNQYALSYVQSIVRNLGYLDKNDNIGISLSDFKSKYPFFTFVLSPDFDIHQTQLPAQGNLKLDIKFSAALAEATTIIIYGIFDSEIQITKSGSILV
jgi:hypothetical protein